MQSYLHVFLQSLFIINGAFKLPWPYASIMVPLNNILEAGFWTVWQMDKWSLFGLDDVGSWKCDSSVQRTVFQLASFYLKNKLRPREVTA